MATLTTTLPFVSDALGWIFSTGSRLLMQSGSTLNIASGAEFQIDGTAITLNASEYNAPDGLATTWPTQISGTPTQTPGAEAANTIAHTVQLYDGKGVAPSQRRMCYVYLSDDSNGDGITGTAATSLAMGANGTLIEELTASKSAMILTDATGKFILNIEYTGGAHTYYVVVCQGDMAYVSSAVTFA